MKKILVTYKLFKEGFSELTGDYELIFPKNEMMPKVEIINKIPDCEAIISMFNQPIDKDIIDAAPNLKIISNYGVGYNNVDIEYARQKGIVVTNTPDPVIEPTAELAFTLMCAVARRMAECDRKLRNNDIKWGVLENLGSNIYRKKLGIIGMGRIGQAVARRAIASGMEILYHNRNRLPVEIEKELNAKYLTFDEILKTSDYLSLHMPLFEETTHIINKEALLNMKKGAFLINTARGSVIDEKALVEVLQSGHLAGVALDVYENEPNITPELLYMDNVLLSPHNGTATVDGRNDMTRYAVENIMRFFNGNEPLSRVV